MKNLDDSSAGWLRFPVRLTPRASRNAIAGWNDDGDLKITITAPPVDEAANLELVKFLSRELGVRKSAVRILGGHRSRRKILEVPDSCKNRLLCIPDI
jgi:uncharacterized protein (TIGR00251 family)